MQKHHLRSPRGDAAILAEPPLDQAGAMIADNAAQLSEWKYDFQGRSADRLMAMARRDVLRKAREHAERFGNSLPAGADQKTRWIATGHQPEMFHPGVWIKNFALAAVARQNDALPVNLIVDNDIPKSASLRVPTRSGDGYASEMVDFDDWAGEIPYEDWAIGDEGKFASFGDRVRAALDGLIPDPILTDYWPLARRTTGITDRVGLRLAVARAELERSWGVHNVEVPLSALCETEAFAWFACHLLAQIDRFQSVHNAALLRYRTLYKIRSLNHPVPELDREGDWLEAPFWIWRKEQPRRRPLLVRQNARTLDLRIAGESDILVTLPLSTDRDACCAVEEIQKLPAQGVRLRTRALTTTMFARLLVGDLFLHGIGGAKYDELGDEVAREFFGIEPPSYLTLSMTLWPGLDADPTALVRQTDLDRQIRDLEFNPDRVLEESPDPAIQSPIFAKRAAIAGPVATRKLRVARFRAIRRANQALQFAVDDAKQRLILDRDALGPALDRNAVAMSREVPFPLHSERRFRAAIRRNVPGLPGF